MILLSQSDVLMVEMFVASVTKSVPMWYAPFAVSQNPAQHPPSKLFGTMFSDPENARKLWINLEKSEMFIVLYYGIRVRKKVVF